MRQKTLWKRLLVWGMLMWVVGCAAPVELPTPVPTAMIPATETPQVVVELPPTRDLATATVAVTETPTVEPTPVFPTATPTPVIGPVINIYEPVEGQPAVMGTALALSGFAQVTADMEIRLGLTNAAGQVLATSVAEVGVGEWTASLTPPELVTGEAQVHAVIVDAGGNEVARDSVSIMLTADRQVNESYVMLFRPEPHSIGVAGHNFFLDGQLWRQGGGRLEVAVLTEGCQENVADIYFLFGISTTWQGYVILPPDVTGPACAAAWVGTPGTEEYRAALVPITILAKSDPQATGLMVSNPRPERRLTAGETIAVTGVAYNYAGGTVNVEILLENGQVVAETEDDADFYGYWSAEVTLPLGVEGEAVARATTGDRVAPEAEVEVAFSIVLP